MMSQELKNLLESWELEEYVENFEREKINKVATLGLIDGRSLQKLIPDLGPQLEFKERMKPFMKKELNEVNTTEANPELPVNDILPFQVDVKESFPMNSEVTIDASTPVIIINSDSNDKPIAPVELKKKSANSDPDSTPSVSTKRARVSSSSLLSLCKSKIEGQLVLAQYQEHNELDECNRNALADLCVKNFLIGDLNRIMTNDDEEQICQDIFDLFPTEKQEVWLGDTTVSRQFSAGRGKLTNRYYNWRRKLAKVNLIQPCERPSNAASNFTVVSDADKEEQQDNLLWLQNNNQPWMQVLELWKKTTLVRHSQLISERMLVHQYMDMFPAFKEPEGYTLLDADFSVLFPGSVMKLFSEWLSLANFIRSHLSPAETESIDESFTPESKKLKTFLFLNKLFSVITAVKKNKSQWRPSRLESKEGLVLFVKTSGDIKTALDARKEKYGKFGLKLGPQVVVVGVDEDSVTECYVVINQRIYKVQNPLKAVAVVFKSMHALDSPYHAECRREWLFLQLAIYEIETPHDKKSLDPKTKAVISAFKDFKSS